MLLAHHCRCSRMLCTYMSFTLVKKFCKTSLVRRLAERDEILAALCVWPLDTYSQNLVNFGPWVPRYHSATRISPSLIALVFYGYCDTGCQ